jgi:DNA-binding NtrC family response regulator
LRNRPEDIPGLIDHALAEFNEKNGMHLSFHPDLVRQLQALPWPGNVRELKNLVWQIASENEEEGGVITLRNGKAMENYNPANLNRELLVDLYRRYGGKMVEGKLDQLPRRAATCWRARRKTRRRSMTGGGVGLKNRRTSKNCSSPISTLAVKRMIR